MLFKKISGVLSLKCELDECTVRWIENWLKGRPQRTVIGITGSGWSPVSSGVEQSSVFQFNLFINDSNEGSDASSASSTGQEGMGKN